MTMSDPNDDLQRELAARAAPRVAQDAVLVASRGGYEIRQTGAQEFKIFKDGRPYNGPLKSVEAATRVLDHLTQGAADVAEKIIVEYKSQTAPGQTRMREFATLAGYHAWRSTVGDQIEIVRVTGLAETTAHDAALVSGITIAHDGALGTVIAAANGLVVLAMDDGRRLTVPAGDAAAFDFSAFVGDAKPSFDQWMSAVDQAVKNKVGLSVYDLDDCPFRDWYDHGESPVSAAAHAIRNAKSASGFDDSAFDFSAMTGDSTWLDDIKAKDPNLAAAYRVVGNTTKPMLRNMVAALKLHPWQNTPEDKQRLAAAEYILSH